MAEDPGASELAAPTSEPHDAQEPTRGRPDFHDPFAPDRRSQSFDGEVQNDNSEVAEEDAQGEEDTHSVEDNHSQEDAHGEEDTRSVEDALGVETSMDAEPSDSSDLLDRLRRAALGDRLGRAAPESVRMAFDPSVDFERRARLLASFSEKPPRLTQRKRGRLRGALLWVPIALSVFVSLAIGSQLLQKKRANLPASGEDHRTTRSTPGAPAITAAPQPTEGSPRDTATDESGGSVPATGRDRSSSADRLPSNEESTAPGQMSTTRATTTIPQ